MKKVISSAILASFFVAILIQISYAGPQSTTYELEEYGFGAGGIQSGTSTNYSIFGTAGEVDNGSIDSSSYTSGNGLVFTMQAHVPPAPTFTNPGSNYERLKFVLATGNNPSDATFAIAISNDNFVTTNYVQSDLTVGTVLGPEDWQTYSSWGGASGSVITGLLANKTYKIKVKAEHGDFTESGWGPTASAATIDSTLTFGVDSAAVTFSNLGPSNSYTDSSKTTILTTSTNAYSGYIVYGRDTQPLTKGSDTIIDYASS
ncbi:hypothetical protein HYS00_03350, partial [Candidatus Microgenomates bacterium]|nr:hypothetical protein [Candidatus Microgenomates bacterium]